MFANATCFPTPARWRAALARKSSCSSKQEAFSLRDTGLLALLTDVKFLPACDLYANLPKTHPYPSLKPKSKPESIPTFPRLNPTLNLPNPNPNLELTSEFNPNKFQSHAETTLNALDPHPFKHFSPILNPAYIQP